MNVSGGEPCEVQDTVRQEPRGIVIADDNGVSITGAAAWKNYNICDQQ